MTGWARRFGSWASGQVSPFGGPSRDESEDNTVTDSDFSYITEEDLEKSHRDQPHHHHHHHQHNPNRAARDTDVLIIRHGNTQQQLHFPAWSISDGQLTVGGAREQIARRLDVGDSRKIRMFWKGHNLKDNNATLRDEGMRSEDRAEILCVVGDQPLDATGQVDESGSDEDVDGEEESSGPADGKARKKKRKSKKKKKSGKGGGASTPTSPGYSTPGAGAEHLPIPTGTHPIHRAAPTSGGNSRGPSPQPPSQPQTPMAKLQAIEDKYRTDLVPGAEAFLENPPSDPAKMQFEHKKFTETILSQVLLKLDGVEVEGDDDARAKRRALVKETQAFLNKLDALAKQ